MIITIDNREHSLYDKLENLQKEHPKPDISIKKEVLPLGDILLTFPLKNEKTYELLIERKSLTDLLASIKDGRYEEQSHRLLHATNMPSRNIVYLIEGVLSTVSTLEKRTILSAVTSIQFFKGFSILRSSSIQESAEWIYFMADKISRSFEKGMFFAGEKEKDMESNETPAYSSFVKKVKKENITNTNIGEIMLCQIPGIQAKYAGAVLQHFGSFSKMVELVKSKTAQFENITYECNGKPRKIPKSCGESIVLYLQNI
jgi:ERCC4-type nuclease